MDGWTDGRNTAMTHGKKKITGKCNTDTEAKKKQ
jgi:hypothetical protein